jgi:hypothetical protein
VDRPDVNPHAFDGRSVHAPTTLPQEEYPPVRIGYEVGWATELIWMYWRAESRGNSVELYRYTNLLGKKLRRYRILLLLQATNLVLRSEIQGKFQLTEGRMWSWTFSDSESTLYGSEH